MTPKLKTALGAFLIAVPADQITKTLVNLNLVYRDKVTVVEDLLYLTHVRNKGAAFGLLDELPWIPPEMEPIVRMVLFIGVTLLAAAIMLSFYRELAPGDRLSALALSLILGGALGNLTDRVMRGEVIDFLHFRLVGGYSWPDFNLADICIVVGVVALAIELLADEGRSRAPTPGTESQSRSTSD